MFFGTSLRMWRKGGGRVAVVPCSTKGGIGRGFRFCSDPAIGIEQDWRGHDASDKTRHRRPVRPPNPNSDGELPVISDRPCIAVAVGCSGLESDPPRQRIIRRRSTAQDVEDVPSGDGIDDAPPQRRCTTLVRMAYETRHLSSPRQAGI